MLIVFLGIFGAYWLNLKVVSQSKARIVATAIANQKIEQIRNLPYKEVGTDPRAVDEPVGDIPKTESILQNNTNFAVETTIKYISDCFDGPRSAECPAAPETDDCVKDYKRAKVKVSWEKPFKGEVNLATDVAPKNLNQEKEECTGAAAGVLSVSVFDALGQAVPFPFIEIIDPLTGNTLTTNQPSNGKYNFVVSPDAYKVKITKSGYSSDQSYQAGDIYNGTTITEPVKSHPAVYEGRLTEVGFSIDILGSMVVQSRGTSDQDYPLIHNAVFEMEGAKLVGRDVAGKSIYKYSQTHVTNGSAGIELSDLEWDSYSFYVDSPDYELIGIESPPETEIEQPVGLLPAENKEARLILKAENTLLTTVKDSTTSDPIFAVSVRLFNLGLGYDRIQPTDEEGETLFIPLQEAAYNLEVQADGYQTYTEENILISGDIILTINLIPSP